MELETVNCGNCGAPLKIPETVDFVTCNHCKSSLAVKRMETVTLTEKLEQTEERLDRAEAHLAQLVYQNRCEGERRRWERESKQHMIKDKHGNMHVPSTAGGAVIMVIMFVMSFFFFASPMPPIGLIPIFIGVGGFFYTMKKSEDYRRAHRAHRKRLRDIPSPKAMLADNSHHNFLESLENAPTPDDYLRELSEAESN